MFYFFIFFFYLRIFIVLQLIWYFARYTFEIKKNVRSAISVFRYNPICFNSSFKKIRKKKTIPQRLYKHCFDSFSNKSLGIFPRNSHKRRGIIHLIQWCVYLWGFHRRGKKKWREKKAVEVAGGKGRGKDGKKYLKGSIEIKKKRVRFLMKKLNTDIWVK